MINITPKVNHIEKITGNVSFSNYQIIVNPLHHIEYVEF